MDSCRRSSLLIKEGEDGKIRRGSESDQRGGHFHVQLFVVCVSLRLARGEKTDGGGGESHRTNSKQRRGKSERFKLTLVCLQMRPNSLLFRPHVCRDTSFIVYMNNPAINTAAAATTGTGPRHPFPFLERLPKGGWQLCFSKQSIYRHDK